MLKKTMIFVGAIIAAAVSMPDAASAAHHRTLHAPRIGYAARPPRRAVAWTSFRRVRPAWGRALASRGLRFVRPASAASLGFHRGYAWHRVAMRRRVATAAQAAPPAPLSGLLPFAVPTPAAAASVVPTAPAVATVPPRAASGGQMGRASFYSGGGRTAAGGHVGAATCAHRSLPFGTRVLVTNLANARSTVLTVNDRGPFVRGRIVDVSVGAAGVLGMLHSGTAPVRVQVVGGPG